MRGHILAAGFAMAISAALTIPAAALGAIPGNDDIGSPIVVGAIPYSNSQDTTDATTGATDVDCAGTEHTVWYAYTADADGRLESNTFGSDYDTTLTVGTPDGSGGLDVIACNDDTNSLQSRVRWDASGGTTYLFQVGSCCGNPGGSLVFNLTTAPPLVPVEITLTVSDTGKVDRSGVATISGTVTCQGTEAVEFYANLRQQVGRFILNADGWSYTECGPTAASWEIQFWTNAGRFGGGKAQVSVFAFGCGDEMCAEAQIVRTITLRK